MTKMNGQKALMDLLKKEGVEYVYGIPGATEVLFMDALEQTEDIDFILGLNEIVCAGMAEGYARATGKPGFLNLHTAPGVAASLGMIYNAHAGGVPLVITSGQQDTRLLQSDPHLSGDIVGTAKTYCKWSTEVMHVEDIPVTIQRAFKMAMQPPTGPVLVSIPQNVLAQTFDYKYKPNTTVFSRMRPDKAALDSAVKILKQAKRPIMFSETGVTKSAAQDEVVKFAELTGARVHQNWMSDVNFPVDHPQYLGDMDPTAPNAVKAFKEFDVLIAVGSPLFGQGFYNPEFEFPTTMKIIQIDENPWEIGKNVPADCGIQGDIKSSLAELNALLEEEMPAQVRSEVADRKKEIAAEKQKINDQLKKKIEQEWDASPISITRLMAEIKNAIDSDTLVVDDCWSSSGLLRQMLDLKKHKQFYRSRKGGSIGWGLPGALGVQLGAPDKKVISVSGDGSAAWSMQSLWTASRYQLPVTYVITNNATYRQVKLVRKGVLGDYPLNEKHLGMEIDEPVIDFSALAESMGVQGVRVEKPEQLASALSSGLESNKPVLIEVMVENKPS
jgi:benzoylformate decarboxylase